mmetsp:Transcript_105917/g.265251  ORF Transcript_105917/g.265251 Transcript_105917/m.265251 type:complete len:271 (+) Transcript_105917:258-1070(+)
MRMGLRALLDAVVCCLQEASASRDVDLHRGVPLAELRERCRGIEVDGLAREHLLAELLQVADPRRQHLREAPLDGILVAALLLGLARGLGDVVGQADHAGVPKLTHHAQRGFLLGAGQLQLVHLTMGLWVAGPDRVADILQRPCYAATNVVVARGGKSIPAHRHEVVSRQVSKLIALEQRSHRERCCHGRGGWCGCMHGAVGKESHNSDQAKDCSGGRNGTTSKAALCAVVVCPLALLLAAVVVCHLCRARHAWKAVDLGERIAADEFRA